MKKNDVPGVVIIEGHVQGLANARAIGKIGVPVYVIDNSNCIARYSKYCIKFFKCPDYSSEEFISFLIDLGKKERLEGWALIPSNDHIVFNLSKNKEKILNVYKTIVPDLNSLLKIYDKYKFLDTCDYVGIPVPRTFLANTFAEPELFSESCPGPMLVKGREGLSFFKSTGKKGIVVNNKIELNKIVSGLLKKLEPEKILIQELIPFNDSSDVWSFCGFSIGGETKTFWIGKKLREHPLRFGTATLAISDYNKNVENFGKKVIKTLNYSGVCEIEFIKDNRDNSFKLIEMNPRTWLWVGLARYCGVDFVAYIYNYLNSVPINFPIDYKKGIKWRNFWTDFLFSFKYFITNKLIVKDYLTQNKGEIVNAVYDKKDKLPFIMMTLMLLYLAKKRSTPIQ